VQEKVSAVPDLSDVAAYHKFLPVLPCEGPVSRYTTAVEYLQQQDQIA